MPKTKLQKENSLEEIKKKIADAKSVVFTDYKGSKMTDLQALRKNIKAKGGKFEVAKITLVTKAFDSAKVKEIVNKASLAIAYSINDEVSTPKEIKKFAKTNPSIKILGGFYEGNFLTASEMNRLADIPSKEELIVKLLGTLKSPLYKLVGNLGGQAPKLVRTLQAIVEKG
ncbi:MAG TPA: 50S ribosomal protein L10 [Patescibacteria group bacterium]|nr:50S ribosomal protein L10 [Patescibacteria group bacterium]